jgi:hypothetical protein
MTFKWKNIVKFGNSMGRYLWTVSKKKFGKRHSSLFQPVSLERPRTWGVLMRAVGNVAEIWTRYLSHKILVHYQYTKMFYNYKCRYEGFLFPFLNRAQSICPRCTAAYRLIVQPWTPTPPNGLNIPISAARPFHLHTTQKILAAKGGTVGENVGR